VSYTFRTATLVDWTLHLVAAGLGARGRASCRAVPMSALRTFVVEDSPVIRESLVAALEEMAPVIVVGQAEDGPTALRWLDDPDNACELVIIDIFLRLGSGTDVLHSLHQRGHAATCVVLTNYATPDIRTRCLGLGAARVFDKSNEIDDLVAYCTDLACGAARRPDGGPSHG